MTVHLNTKQARFKLLCLYKEALLLQPCPTKILNLTSDSLNGEENQDTVNSRALEQFQVYT